jgi:hypothetical protein
MWSQPEQLRDECDRSLYWIMPQKALGLPSLFLLVLGIQIMLDFPFTQSLLCQS